MNLLTLFETVMINECAQAAEPLPRKWGPDLLACPNCGNPHTKGKCCDVQCRVELHRWRKSLLVEEPRKVIYTTAQQKQDAQTDRRHWVIRTGGKRKLKVLRSENEHQHGLLERSTRKLRKPKTNYCPQCRAYVLQNHQHTKVKRTV